MPPPKRNRGTHDDGTPADDGSPDAAGGLLFDAGCHDLSAGALSDSYQDLHSLGMSMGGGGGDGGGLLGPGMVQASTLPWRALQMSDAPLLQRGCSVKVYRADERWHNGVLENVCPCWNGCLAASCLRTAGL